MYHHIHDAAQATQPLNLGGSLYLMMLVASRWLTRPMVPFPGKLSAAEKAYFRPYLFQANSEAEADHPLNAQGMQWFQSRTEGLLLANILRIAEGAVRKALAELKRTPAVASDFQWLGDRLKTWICLLRCASHFIQFYTLLHSRFGPTLFTADAVIAHKPDRPEPRERGDFCLRTELYDLMRAEIDTTHELIGLLRSAPSPLVTAPPGQPEDPLLLGSDLVPQLTRKVETMWRHWMDVDEVAARPNL